MGFKGGGFGRWVLILILRLMSFDFVYDFFKLIGYVVVDGSLVAGLMEIGFSMQNQTLKIILWHIFHKVDKQLKIFSFFVKHFHLKTFYTWKIFYILPNAA